MIKIIKKILVFVLVFAISSAFSGCNKPAEPQSSADVEVIIEEETIVWGDNSMTEQNSSVSSESTQQNSSEPQTSTPSENSSVTTLGDTTSVESTPSEPETVNTNYEWKSHSQDYKLLAFTFDDGPSTNMTRYVQLFSAFEGAGTFFVRGNSIKGDYSYNMMQSAINAGWDLGNHGDNHLVATNGGANGEATYDEIKADIDNLTNKLHTNLKNADGTQYEVNLYRPPNIKPTANTFKICNEEKLAVIWLKYDALDWDQTKTYQDRYKVFDQGLNTWVDGDVILCHETGVVGAEDTYKILEQLLPQFYKAGYRFCSITELMRLRGISQDQISGELNNVNGNRGMVTNILDAAAAGKK